MITQEIIEKARHQVDAVQASLQRRQTSDINFEDDYLKAVTLEQRTDLQVKVIRNGRVGVSTTTDPEDVEGVIQRAVEAAEFGVPAAYEMPGRQVIQQVQTFDEALLPLTHPDLIQLGQGMMEAIKSYNGEIKAGAGVNRSVVQIEFANSAGAAYRQEHTNFSLGAGGVLVRGTDILWTGYGMSKKSRAIDPEDIAERAIATFRMAERTAPVRSGTLPVIFTPGGLSALLLSLGLGLDGKNVYLGASPLKGKLDQPVADPRFSLVDDPLIDFGARSSSFDEEGMPRQRLPLIENGVLRNFVYDLDTASRAKARPTGHGPNRAYSNLVISPGARPYLEMIHNMKEGLLVDEYIGLGQGNPINGEFSANVYLGFKIENGEIVGRVKDVMLAGNAYQALKSITEISQDRDWVQYPYAGLVPYIQVEGLNITAK
jgi:PmbA protein